jgi:hypothetical protein
VVYLYRISACEDKLRRTLEVSLATLRTIKGDRGGGVVKPKSPIYRVLR